MTQAELEEAVLVMGRARNWESFWWLPSSSIPTGESKWRKFVAAHSDQELQHTLERANQSSRVSDGQHAERLLP